MESQSLTIWCEKKPKKEQTHNASADVSFQYYSGNLSNKKNELGETRTTLPWSKHFDSHAWHGESSYFWRPCSSTWATSSYQSSSKILFIYSWVRIETNLQGLILYRKRPLFISWQPCDPDKEKKKNKSHFLYICQDRKWRRVNSRYSEGRPHIWDWKSKWWTYRSKFRRWRTDHNMQNENQFMVSEPTQ